MMVRRWYDIELIRFISNYEQFYYFFPAKIQDISSVIILKIDIGPMTWLEIEKQFADLIEVGLGHFTFIFLQNLLNSFFLYYKKVAKPLNQIVDAIKSNTQNEASKDAIKKVDKAIEELNKLKNLLKVSS